MHRTTAFLLSSAVIAGILVTVLFVVAGPGAFASAAPSSDLALATERRVCPTCPYTTIQAAVDAADPGDTIKVAQGVYTGVQNVPSLNTATFTATQIVVITKSLTLQGGYTTTDWTTPDPAAHPTTLDAGGQGRVLVITSTITPTIEGLRITGGDATGLGGVAWGQHVGGGVYIYGAAPVISNNLIYSNTAERAAGLYLNGSAATLNSNTINNNMASTGTSNGAELYRSPATLSKNTIRDNGKTVTGWGGGLLLYSSNALLDGNIISNNTGAYGGGVSVFWSNATLTGNTITGNSGYRGGGVHLYGGAATLGGNLIVGNTSIETGGGVYFWANGSTLINTVVADNRLSSGAGLGAGIYLDDASAPHLVHTTLAHNQGGDGSGIYVTGYEWSGTYYASSVALTNTIIVSHTVGITVTAGNTATLNATLWHANATDRAGAGAITHSNDYTGDPAFAADGYHLTPGSAAKDKGVDAGVTTDIDGQARPQGGGYDLGVDELQSWCIYLPLVVRNR